MVKTLPGKPENISRGSGLPRWFSLLHLNPMIPKALALLSSAALLSATAAAETAGLHLLQPFQGKPGQTLVIKTSSESNNGEIIVTEGAAIRKGALSIKSNETLERTISGTGAEQKLQYRTLVDQRSITSRFGSTENSETTTGALIGKTVEGMRDQSKQWRLFAANNSMTTKTANAVSELEAYENRRLFIDQPVAIGQSWPIDPGFIRHLIERDLGKTPIKAVMTFKAIETIDDEPTAMLSFTIESAGTKQVEGTEKQSAARISVTGNLQVVLSNMLDKKTTITGSLTTMTISEDKSTSVTIPINMTVTKSLR